MIGQSGAPKVSVIINCHNGARFLQEAIDSVFDQTYEDWEIVFWDNASSDASADIAQSYGEKLKYFRSNRKTSLYQARNDALAKAHGEYVAFLDCDDIWLPNKLAIQIREVSADIAIVYGRFQSFSGKPPILEAKKCAPGPSGWITNTLLRRNVISIGAVLIAKKVLEKHSFDPEYNLLGDFELWIRLSQRYQIKTVGYVVELSRSHDENLSDMKRDSWAAERRKFYRKFIAENGFFKFSNIIRYVFITEAKALLGRR